MRTLLIAAFLFFSTAANANFFCSGCGCKGGPGWRHNEDGKCMGHHQWRTRCGDPPTQRCTCEVKSPETCEGQKADKPKPLK
jgi:hypothetical protein